MEPPEPQPSTAPAPLAASGGAPIEGAGLLDAVFQATSSGLLVVDTKGAIVRVNEAMARMISLMPEGASRSPAERLAIVKLVSLDGTPYRPDQLPGVRALRGETVLDESIRIVLASGKQAAFAVSAAPFRDERGAITGAVLRFLDITARLAAEDGLRRASSAMAMLSRCNEALLRATTEEALFRAVCQAVVEEGGYELAWVGVPEHDERKTVRVVAHAGKDEGFLCAASPVWSDDAQGSGPAGLALREGRLVINLDVERDPSVAPWRDLGLGHGFRAVTALPLVRGGQRLGVLVMYAAQVRTADPTEQRVLTQMADDLAFGVSNLRAARRQEEDAARLTASERRLRLLADNTQDVIWLLDLETLRYTYMSPSITRLRGLSVEEALAEPIAQSLTPASLARVAEVMSWIGTPRESDPHTEIFDQPCKDGSIKHVDITTSLIRDGSGRPVVALGVSRDATARVEAERGLRESEARYRQLFRHMLHGFAWCKMIRDERGQAEDWVYLDVNAAFGRLTGIEDAVGRRMSDLFPGALAAQPELLAAYDRVTRGGPPEKFEIDFLPLGGRTLSISVHSPLPDQFVAVFDDVTEQRRAAKAIQHSEERFRALVEKSSEMVFLLDEAGTITFWPKAATQALGLGDEQVGVNALTLVHPSDAEALRKAFRDLRGQPGSTSNLSVRVATSRGTWRELEGVLHNLLGEPAVRALVATLRDVTAQHELEAKYRQSQKLESIGRLAGGVAHDFNNLLTVILSCSEALDNAVKSGGPVFEEDIDEIKQAGLRARDLTRQLLAFARKQVIAPVRLDLNQAVRSSEKLLRRVLGEDVQLVVETAPGVCPALADPGQIEQVLLNLAVNARDAMPGGGQLTLQTRIEAGAHAGAQGHSHVQVIVRDTGSGIPPEVREHLFEPFFTTKELGKGTGLGLATVHGIVAQAGGHLHVESEPGRGATFTVCLPRSEAATSRPVLQALRAPTTTGTERLLLVEDDPRVRAITLRALQGAGYKVDVAQDGVEALALSRRQGAPYDLVVTDVVMPGPSVIEVVDGLRAGRPGLKVLYISGYTHDANSRQGVLEAGLRFLAKPFTASALLARVRAVLDEPVAAGS